MDQGSAEGLRGLPGGSADRNAYRVAIAAKGAKADIAKPLRGFGSGVFEIALKHRSDAFRVVYVVQLAEALWVIHAFQKKSKTGIKTPKLDLDLIAGRLKRLKEQLA